MTPDPVQAAVLTGRLRVDLDVVPPGDVIPGDRVIIGSTLATVAMQQPGDRVAATRGYLTVPYVRDDGRRGVATIAEDAFVRRLIITDTGDPADCGCSGQCPDCARRAEDAPLPEGVMFRWRDPGHHTPGVPAEVAAEANARAEQLAARVDADPAFVPSANDLLGIAPDWPTDIDRRP